MSAVNMQIQSDPKNQNNLQSFFMFLLQERYIRIPNKATSSLDFQCIQTITWDELSQDLVLALHKMLFWTLVNNLYIVLSKSKLILSFNSLTPDIYSRGKGCHVNKTSLLFFDLNYNFDLVTFSSFFIRHPFIHLYFCCITHNERWKLRKYKNV